MLALARLGLAKAEQRKNSENNHRQADKMDDIHEVDPLSPSVCPQGMIVDR